MPLRIEAADRKLLLSAGVVVSVLVLLLAVATPVEEQELGYPSTYSGQSGGAKAAFLLLKELGYNVERWQRAPEHLPEDGAGTLLILAEPLPTMNKAHRDHVRRFVSKGSRVLAVGWGSMLAPEEQARFLSGARIWETATPVVPSRLTAGGEITMTSRSEWRMDQPSHVPHYATSYGHVVVVSYRFGAGEVIWWAGATPLTNAGISKPGNLELFLASVGPKDGQRVLWDEYFHGHQRVELDTGPAVWGLAQLGIFALALVLTFSRRSGPVRPLPERSRLSPLEFVETLGGLYQRAGATQAAVEVAYQRFRYLLARRLGVRSQIKAEEIERALAHRLGQERGLAELLTRCEDAVGDPGLRESEALRLVQELEQYSRRLQLGPEKESEKKSWKH